MNRTKTTWNFFVLFLVISLIGVSIFRGIDAWTNYRSQKAWSSEFRDVYFYSVKMYKQIINPSKITVEHLDHLIEYVYKLKRRVSNEEIKSMVMADVMDLQVARFYMRIANSTGNAEYRQLAFSALNRIRYRMEASYGAPQLREGYLPLEDPAVPSRPAAASNVSPSVTTVRE
jgi:hypothetical protein